MSTPIQISSATRHAPTRNALALERAGLAALRADGAERIVAICGPVGAGKSHGAARIVATHDAVFVRLRVVDTTRTLAQTLCAELQLRPGKTTAECFDLIVRELRARPRLLVWDEFQLVVGARGVHLVRDLHDETEAKFLVVGDDMLRRNLERHRDKAFHDRVILWQNTIPLSVEDLDKIAKAYAANVKISEDLMDLLQRQCAGNCRLAVNTLRQVVEIARRDGLERLDAKIWRERHGQVSDTTLRVVR